MWLTSIVGKVKTSLKLLVAVVVGVGVIACWFWSEFGPSVREAHQKEAAFRALGPAEFHRLIDLACMLEKKDTGVATRSFGGDFEPPIPSEFSGFGFDRLEIRSGIVEGRIYWLVDSGAFARIDTRTKPLRLLLVRGDHADIIDILYEKKEPIQSTT